MDYSNRKWVIITKADHTDEEILAFENNAINTTTRSNGDGTKLLFKWDGNTPSCFSGITTFTHAQILTELKKDEWNSNA